jgi:hypothetical protein
MVVTLSEEKGIHQNALGQEDLLRPLHGILGERFGVPHLVVHLVRADVAEGTDRRAPSRYVCMSEGVKISFSSSLDLACP